MTDDKQRRIMQAQALLENELFLEAFAALEKKYLTLMTESEFKDSHKRDEGYLGLKTIADIKNYLQYIIKCGKLKK